MAVGRYAELLCPDNGGNSGAGYWGNPVRLATPRAIRRQRPGRAFTLPRLSVLSFQRVLVLFTVFTDVMLGRLYAGGGFCQGNFVFPQKLGTTPES